MAVITADGRWAAVFAGEALERDLNGAAEGAAVSGLTTPQCSDHGSLRPSPCDCQIRRSCHALVAGRLGIMPQYMGIDHRDWESVCPRCAGSLDWWFANGYRTSPDRVVAVFVPECTSCPEGAGVPLAPKHHSVSRRWGPQEAGPLKSSS